MKRWPTKPLRELIAIEKGKKAPEVLTTPTKTSLRYLQIEDLRPDANLKFCEPFNCPKATKSDAIIAWDGANAGTVSCNLNGHIGSTLAVLRPIEANTLSAVFLSRFLQGNFEYLQKTATGATIPHVSKNALTTLRIPVPPLAEQERIVKLLNEADELRKLRAQADRRTAALLPALFHEMFGDPVANPKGWPIKTLGALCELINGAPFKPSDWDGSGLPIVRIQNLNDSTKPFNFTSKQLSERFRVRPGDILLSWSGTPGTSFGCFRWKGPAGWLNQHIFNVKLKGGFDGEFFIQSVNARLNELIARAHGGVGLQHVTKGTLNAVEMLIPPLPLQKEFATRVSEIRRLESEQATSRRRLEDLFQSTLHRAFQGEL